MILGLLAGRIEIRTCALVSLSLCTCLADVGRSRARPRGIQNVIFAAPPPPSSSVLRDRPSPSPFFLHSSAYLCNAALCFAPRKILLVSHAFTNSVPITTRHEDHPGTGTHYVNLFLCLRVAHCSCERRLVARWYVVSYTQALYRPAHSARKKLHRLGAALLAR